MARPRQRAVLVDVGGVLCSDELSAVTADWSRRLGITARSLRGAIYGGSDQTVLIGREREEAWWKVVADRLGVGADVLNALRHEIASAGAWDEELLAFLRSVQGRTRVAIVSNAWPHLRARLTREHVEEVFDEVILSCEVGCAKPDTRIYRLALGRLSVTPGRALLIDDTREYVAAAVSVGLCGHVCIGRTAAMAAIDAFLGDEPCP
jgi:putative hydrolase of the HAD superfamily